LGHAREMAVASGVSLVIDHAAVEFLPEALDYSRQGFIPGGLKRNIEFIAGCVEFVRQPTGIPEEIRNLLFDPQTSGGLLLAVEAGEASDLLRSLARQPTGVPARDIGEVVEKTKPLIMVR
ncbi:MAG: selenide, water dikinase SelD, partial [Acidobacteria bacterium]|nr:selenide, water dikinase SelD [Acidobacteriota bacterium]